MQRFSITTKLLLTFWCSTLSFAFIPSSNRIKHSLIQNTISRREWSSTIIALNESNNNDSEPSSSTVISSTSESSTQPPSTEWELDCYSRPVLTDGKKLWEILITDSTGSFRVCKPLPSNRVNSRELRQVIEETIENSPVKPTIIRFFRGAMFNMINIALSEIEVISKPSRRTYALGQWLGERHRDVYPKMEGYKPSMAAASSAGSSTTGSFLDVRTPTKLPDALRGEKYAFVSLPLAEFLPGGDIDKDNIGVGKLCPIDEDLPGDAFVQGLVILTSRPKALAAWMAGTEIAGMKCDLRKRILIMETDISTQYLVARLNDDQRKEGEVFEEGKDSLGGLHFVSVMRDEDEDPEGFWLLKDIPDNL